MKILFQYFTGGGGALSNIILLLQSLANKYSNDHIYIVCSKTSDLHVLNSNQNITVIPYGGKLHQEIDRIRLGFIDLNKIARELNVDVIWSLNLGPYLKPSVPHVLSVNNPHQVYPWEVTRYHPDSRFNVAALRFFFRRSLKFSDAVIVQTPIMGKLIGMIKGCPKLIKVVEKSVENSQDVNQKTLPPDILEFFSSTQSQGIFNFLYVSTYTPHKNHKVLIKVFEILSNNHVNARLFLTIHHNELISLGGDLAKKLVSSGHLIPLGWIKKEHLKSLYDACDASLMPSVLESLSSTHLEAMQWGKPQITSDLPYARDLCGNAAIYASPDDPLDWVRKIKQLLDDENLRKSLIHLGHERMKNFPLTWADSAKNVHDFLEEVVDRHTHNR